MRVCVRVCVCILTVCLGIGGSPDGLFVSASSFRMWSVLMYESYRPSPWRAAGTVMNKVNQCDDVRLLNLQQKHRTILEGDVNRMQFNFLHWDALSLFDQIRQCPINHLINHTSSSSYPDAKTNCIVQLDKSLEPPQQDILHLPQQASSQLQWKDHHYQIHHCSYCTQYIVSKASAPTWPAYTRLRVPDR